MKYLIFLSFFGLVATQTGCDDTSKKPCGWGSTYEPVAIRLFWTINGKREFLGREISFDTCLDVNATYARVVITGPENYVHTGETLCTSMEYIISDNKCTPFPPGMYNIQIALQNSSRTDITGIKHTSTRVNLENTPPETREVDFDLESFFTTFQGTLWYILKWNGKNCAGAEPPVHQVDVAFYNEDGTRIPEVDYSGICFLDKTVQGIPTGDYQLRVTGSDDEGVIQYCGAIPVRVGAGVTNPSWEVPLVTDPDGCVDFEL